MVFAIGDRVNWQYESRGGWGYGQTVAAVVVGTTPNRIRIRVAEKVGPEWRLVTKTVKPSRLTCRMRHVPIVDDVETDPCPK